MVQQQNRRAEALLRERGCARGGVPPGRVGRRDGEAAPVQVRVREGHLDTFPIGSGAHYDRGVRG